MFLIHYNVVINSPPSTSKVHAGAAKAAIGKLLVMATLLITKLMPTILPVSSLGVVL